MKHDREAHAIVTRTADMINNWQYTLSYIAVLLTLWFVLTLTGHM